MTDQSRDVLRYIADAERWPEADAIFNLPPAAIEAALYQRRVRIAQLQAHEEFLRRSLDVIRGAA